MLMAHWCLCFKVSVDKSRKCMLIFLKDRFMLIFSVKLLFQDFNFFECILSLKLEVSVSNGSNMITYALSYKTHYCHNCVKITLTLLLGIIKLQNMVYIQWILTSIYSHVTTTIIKKFLNMQLTVTRLHTGIELWPKPAAVSMGSQPSRCNNQSRKSKYYL